MNAACDGDVSKVVEMVEAGMPVDITDGVGWTALIRAAMNNRTDVVRCLLDKGADVNKQHPEAMAMLHFANIMNRTDAMRMLLEHRARKDIKDEHGATPIDNARWRNNKEAVDLLEQY